MSRHPFANAAIVKSHARALRAPPCLESEIRAALRRLLSERPDAAIETQIIWADAVAGNWMATYQQEMPGDIDEIIERCITEEVAC